MPSVLRIPFLSLSVFFSLILALVPGAAVAECPEESWVGPAIVLAPDSGDEGIGGSGVVPDADGIGGSGRTGGDEDGIGGSGVAPGAPEPAISALYGTLTAFGSLCVNGARVEYTEDVPVRVDEVVASAADLAVGQVVRVVTRTEGDRKIAVEVAVEHAVVGPVTRVREEGFTVMGQAVVSDAKVRGSVEVGDRVAVSGLRREDGAVVASRVVSAAPEAPDLVRGAVADAPGGFRIGNTRVSPPDGSEVRPDERAVFAGRWDDGEGRHLAERHAPAPRAPDDARTIEVEGYVRADAGGGLSVGGVALDPSVVSSTLSVGDRVRVRVERGPRGGPPRIDRIVPIRPEPLLRGLDQSIRRGDLQPLDPPRGVDRGRMRRPPRAREDIRPPQPPKPPPLHDLRRARPDARRPPP